MAKVAKDAKELRWKAYQTSQDGTVTKWIGPENSEHPAPVTKVIAANENISGAATDNTQNTSLPFYLSIASVVISILALIISLVRRRK